MLAEWIIDETVIALGRLRAENAALKADDEVNTQEITRYRDLWTQAADQATQLREDVRTLRAENRRLLTFPRPTPKQKGGGHDSD